MSASSSSQTENGLIFDILPNEMISTVLEIGFVSKDDLGIPTISKLMREVFDAMVSNCWNKIKKSVLENGLKRLIAQIEQAQLGPFQKFQRLYYICSIPLKEGQLLLEAQDFLEAHKNFDDSLKTIWQCIKPILNSGPDLHTQDAQGIRGWLNRQNVDLSQIVELDLNLLGLKALSPEIAKLTGLKSLFVCNNQLTFIPEEVKKLTRLEMVNMDNNHLTSLPDLSRFACLKTFCASENQLTSLQGLGQLTELEEFCVCQNNLSSLSGLNNLTKLTYLALSKNKLISLESLEMLSRLEMLYLSCNQLAVFPKPKGLVRLKTLDLSNNQISSIPEISDLTRLESLNLEGNPLACVSPLEVLTQLKQCSSIGNRFILRGLDDLLMRGYQSN